MSDKEFPQESVGVWKLMGDFDKAVWKRITASEEGASKAFLKALEDDVYPKSAEEIAVWNELISPGNRKALHKYVAYHAENVSSYAKKLFDALVAESDRRAATQAGGASNGPSSSGT